MNKLAEEQITTILKKWGFPVEGFKFVRIKDNIFKMCYEGKFITYIEVLDIKSSSSSSQVKLWTAYRKDLIDYIKKVISGAAFELVCIMDVKDSGVEIVQRAINSLYSQNADLYIIMITASLEDTKIAVENNIDFFWIQEKSQYARLEMCINNLRKNIKETKNIMVCNSNDIFQRGWIDECLTLLKKKCDVAGKSDLYLIEETVNYKISLDQEFAKKVVPQKKEKWEDVCLYNGLLFRKSLLTKLKWVVVSKMFETNISLGLHERFTSVGARIGYVKNSTIVSVFMNKLSYSLKEILPNKCFSIENIKSLPVGDTRFLDIPGIKTKPVVYSGPIGSSGSEIEIEKDKEKSKKETKVVKYMPLKVDRRQIVSAYSNEELIEEEEIDYSNVLRRMKLYNGKEATKQNVQRAFSIKSPNRIVTLIVCTPANRIDDCLKHIRMQTVKTDILLLMSGAGGTIEENFLMVDSNSDKDKIVKGLNYIKNFNPSFVMIIYDFLMLSSNWVADSLAYMKRNDLDVAGIDSVYVYNSESKELILKKFVRDNLPFLTTKSRDLWPLHYGMIFYNRILHKVDWNIFSTNLDLEINVSIGMRLIEKCIKFKCIDKLRLLIPYNNNEKNQYFSINDTSSTLTKIYRDEYDAGELTNIWQFFRSIFGDRLNIQTKKKSNLNSKLLPYLPLESIMSAVPTIPYSMTNEDLFNNVFRLSLDRVVESEELLTKENLVVQGLWIGDQLSVLEQLCVLSFINHGHEFHLYVYDKVKNVPKGCIMKNANDIIPQTEIFYYDSQQSLSGKITPAAFSNMFRYKLLLDRGGYWVDMDMICLKPFNFKDSFVFSSEHNGETEVINCGVMKCPKGSDFAKYCYNICKGKNKETLKWGEIGPALTKDGVYRFGLQKSVKSWSTFCPVDYRSVYKFTNGYNLQIDEEWYGIHLWNELWRKNKFNKDTISFEFITTVLFDTSFVNSINKAGVLLFWIPIAQYTNRYKNEDEKRVILRGDKSDNAKLDDILENDIYVQLMYELQKLGVINSIHVVFCVKDGEYDAYGNKFSLFDSTYLMYKSVHFWRLNTLSYLFIFKNASYIFNRSFYESLFVLGRFSKYSFITNYPATAFYQTITDNNEIKYNPESFKSTFPYDNVLMDEIDKLDLYKSTFRKTKEFIKFYKTGFEGVKLELERCYDIIYFGSDQYPTKNTGLFVEYLKHLDFGQNSLRVCFVSKFSTKEVLPVFKNIKVEVINDVAHQKVKEILCKSKNLVIFSGRDANPRIISEALSCGVYCICLSILSDGYSIFKDEPTFGSIVECSKIFLDEKHHSLCCREDVCMFDEITEKIKTVKIESEIQSKFGSYIKKKGGLQIERMYESYKKSCKGVYVITLATEDYLKPMNYLLSSIKHTNPDISVVSICVNCDKSLISEFSRKYTDYYFFEYFIGKHYEKGDILKLKVDVQHYFFNTFEKPFLWIDADSVVTKNMKPLLYELWDYNMMVFRRPEEEDYMKFAVGVIGFGFGNDINITKFLLDEYKKATKNSKGFNGWFHDQIALWEVYQEHKKDLKVYSLKEYEHSLSLNKHSIVISRRKHGESFIQKILTEIRCPIAEINFGTVKMSYDY